MKIYLGISTKSGLLVENLNLVLGIADEIIDKWVLAVEIQNIEQLFGLHNLLNLLLNMRDVLGLLGFKIFQSLKLQV